MGEPQGLVRLGATTQDSGPARRVAAPGERPQLLEPAPVPPGTSASGEASGPRVTGRPVSLAQVTVQK